MKVIDELQLFETELEAVAEFNGFTDLFHSFELYRGKVIEFRVEQYNTIFYRLLTTGQTKTDKLVPSKAVSKFTECQYQKMPSNLTQLMACSKVLSNESSKPKLNRYRSSI